MTIRELVETGVPRRTAYSWVESGRLPVVTPGTRGSRTGATRVDRQRAEELRAEYVSRIRARMRELEPDA